MSGVTVYGFWTYGNHVESVEVAGHKATLDAIHRLGGEVLPGSAEEVTRADLDTDGFYRRRPTGWGDLSGPAETLHA